MLRRALKFHAKDMIDKCVYMIARNFCHIYDVDYNFLPPNIFLRILSNKYLAVKNEYNLYKQVPVFISCFLVPLFMERVLFSLSFSTVVLAVHRCGI
jgi:hypothetical protein